MLHLALSQAEYGHAILQDIGLICVVMVLIAGGLHAYLRKAIPGLAWNQQGKVSTKDIGPSDIAASLLVSLPFSLTLLVPYQEPTGNLSPMVMAVNFAILLLMAGAVIFVFKMRDMLPEALGLQPKHPAKVFAWAVAMYVCFILLLMGLDGLGMKEWLAERLGPEQRQVVVKEMIAAQDVQKKLIMILGACVIAPVAEEIIFRGYLYPVVKRYTEPVVAALFTGIMFGAIHGNAWAMIALSIFGVLLAVLYEKSGSIWACILCHALFNGINTVVMLTMGDQL